MKKRPDGNHIDPKLPWRRCLLGGAVMLPIAMLLVFLALGFLPPEAEREAKAWLERYWWLSSAGFYLAGVVLFRQLRFDFRRKDDWDAGL